MDEAGEVLLKHLEARRRLRGWRRLRIRRRAHRVAPWLAVLWLLLNIPSAGLFVMVVAQGGAPASGLLRYALAVVLWGVISGLGLLLLVWIGLLSVEIGGRRAAGERKLRRHGRPT